MTQQILSWLGQTALAMAGALVAFLVLLPTKVGDRFISFQFDRRLNELKDRQNHEIEKLKEQLAHVGDRGKRSNEREFVAISVVWEKFVDAYQSTRQCVVQFISHPDLKRMTDEDVRAFLEAGELSEQQRDQVISSQDKNTMYSNVVTFRMINKAASDIYELRLLIRKNGIFIPVDLRKATTEAVDLLSSAQSEAYMRHQFRDHGIPREASMKFMKDGEALFESLMESIKARIHREGGPIG